MAILIHFSCEVGAFDPAKYPSFFMFSAIALPFGNAQIYRQMGFSWNPKNRINERRIVTANSHE
jgi:hypothetical protein